MSEETAGKTADQSVDLQHMPELVIVTGMSGAGRTEAMHSFEDLGYFCVDNLPSSLIGNLLELTGMPGQPDEKRRLAVVCDARNRDFFASLAGELKKLKGLGIDYRILFLDAADEKLVARYKSSRRRHPLCADGASIAQGIERERDLLFEVRENAHHVIDTTSMLPPQLRSTIRALFAPGEERAGLSVTVYSFGFKHGAPLDADLVMDVRFLPNPYYEPQLRSLTGLDKPVSDFVLSGRIRPVRVCYQDVQAIQAQGPVVIARNLVDPIHPTWHDPAALRDAFAGVLKLCRSRRR